MIDERPVLSSALETFCHCRAVRIGVPRLPEELNECGCSICRSYGVRWAYYAVAELALPPPARTEVYSWGERILAFHRCRICGCVTHWRATDAREVRMAINARLFAPEAIAGVPVKHTPGPPS